MGKIMIDTDVLIDLLEKKPISILRNLSMKYDFYVSGIVAFEFLTGIYKTKKLKLKKILENNFNIVPISYEIIDLAAEIEAGLMEQGKMLDPRDLLIGATAIFMNIPLRTNNIKDFKRLEKYGLKLKDKFD
ncbi:MAG: type II toxin-antitoxin system VapC family toxin [Candidatus Njordarchaeales archaeon]